MEEKKKVLQEVVLSEAEFLEKRKKKRGALYQCSKGKQTRLSFGNKTQSEELQTSLKKKKKEGVTDSSQSLMFRFFAPNETKPKKKEYKTVLD